MFQKIHFLSLLSYRYSRNRIILYNKLNLSSSYSTSIKKIDPLKQLIEEKEKAFKDQKEKQYELFLNSSNSQINGNKELISKLQSKLDLIKSNQDELKNDLNYFYQIKSTKKVLIENNLLNNTTKKTDFDYNNYIQLILKKYIDPNIQLLNNQFSNLKLNITTQKQSFKDKFNLLIKDFFILCTKVSQLINDITGYSNIHKIQFKINALENQLLKVQNDVKNYKKNYTQVIELRDKTQKDINELLARKHEWTPVDLEKFTEFYRTNHNSDKNVAEAENKLLLAESNLEKTRLDLLHEMSNKYHQEQLWTNKMKSLSTWVTVSLIGLNFLILLLSQLLFEPLKSKRIINNLEPILAKNNELIQQEMSNSIESLLKNQGILVKKIESLEENLNKLFYNRLDNHLNWLYNYYLRFLSFAKFHYNKLLLKLFSNDGLMIPHFYKLNYSAYHKNSILIQSAAGLSVTTFLIFASLKYIL